MSEYSEIQRIILEVDGREKLEQYNKALREEKEAIAELLRQLKAGSISLDEFGDKAGAAAQRAVRLEQSIREANRAAGNPQGMLQLSYVIDDLVNTSGGLERKLAAVSNNIPGLVASLGAGGMAGAVGILSTALIALTPVARAAVEALFGREQSEEITRRIQDIRKQIEEAHKEFEKLANAPTDMEKLSAQGIGLFLGERPNADRARAAVAAALPIADVRGLMAPDQLQQLDALTAQGGVSDEDLRARAYSESIGPEGGAPAPAVVEARFQALRRERDRARQTAGVLTGQARQSAAERVIAGARKAGPEGYVDRERLLRLTAGIPGFDELQGYRPEALEAQEADYEANVLPGFERAEESGRAAARGLRRMRAEATRKARERARLKSQQTDAVLHAHAQQIAAEREAEAQEAAEADRDLERSNAAWARGKGARRVRALVPGVRQTSEAMGFGTPTDEQARQMAQQAISLTGQGVSTNDAILSAVMSKAQEIDRLNRRLVEQQMQARRLMMGGDNTNNFSMMPAGPF